MYPNFTRDNFKNLTASRTVMWKTVRAEWHADTRSLPCTWSVDTEAPCIQNVNWITKISYCIPIVFIIYRNTVYISRITKYRNILTHGYSNQQMAVVPRGWEGWNHKCWVWGRRKRIIGVHVRGEEGICFFSLTRCVLFLHIVLSLSLSLSLSLLFICRM